MAHIINLMEYKNSKEEEKRRIREEMALHRKHDVLLNTIHMLQKSIGTTFLTRKIDEYGQMKGEEIVIDEFVMDSILDTLENLSKDMKSKISEIAKPCE